MKHTVILVHGIRTHASWFQRAKEVFLTIDGLQVEPIRYGRYDLFRFLIPGPWRRGPINTAKTKILPILDRCKTEGRTVTVIAHSNGTHVVTQLLKEEVLFRTDNLIMCGSIVDSNYAWEVVQHKIAGKIINDYGVRDFWPAVAKSVTWGYGYSGTNGFSAPVNDRLHNTGHSEYFSIDFMRKYWLSFLQTGEIVPTVYGDSTPETPWWFTLFEIPWKWLIAAGLVALASWAIFGLTEDDGKLDDRTEDVVQGSPPTQRLFAYYAIGHDRRPLPVKGHLTVDGVPGELPVFEDIKPGMVLKALERKNLRLEPTTNSAEVLLAAGQCVKVLQGQTKIDKPVDGLSGGWIPVERTECKLNPSADSDKLPVEASATATENPANVPASLLKELSRGSTARAQSTVTLRSGGQEVGHRVDVFWCNADNAAEHESQALRVGRLLADYTNLGVSFGDGRLTTIRVKSLSAEANGSGLFPTLAYANEIRYTDDREKSVVEVVSAAIEQQMNIVLRPQEASSRADNYISIFICG